MTMEFLTLNDAKTKTPHRIASMIMQTIMTASELLQNGPRMWSRSTTRSRPDSRTWT
jgi:hypothetical protein